MHRQGQGRMGMVGSLLRQGIVVLDARKDVEDADAVLRQGIGRLLREQALGLGKRAGQALSPATGR